MQIYKDQKTISTLNKELTYKTGKIDSLEKEVDNLNNRSVVPLQQYVDDINFMESVVWELRGEFERECGKSNYFALFLFVYTKNQKGLVAPLGGAG